MEGRKCFSSSGNKAKYLICMIAIHSLDWTWKIFRNWRRMLDWGMGVWEDWQVWNRDT